MGYTPPTSFGKLPWQSSYTPQQPAPQQDYSWVRGYASQYENPMPKMWDLTTNVTNTPSPTSPTNPPPPARPTSNNRSSGGGGGGAAAYRPSQSLIDAMSAYLNRGQSQYKFTPYSGASYQQYQPRPFDNALYENFRNQLRQAFTSDQAAQQQGFSNVANQLGLVNQAYQQARGVAAPSLTPQMEQSMRRLAGPDSGYLQAQIDQQNASARTGDDMLRNVLALNEIAAGQAQQSRNHQLDLARLFAEQQLAGQRTGVLGGIDMAELQARQAYQQYLDQVGREESRYAQDWTRQTDLQNWEGGNQEALLNWQAMMDMYGTRMNPILQMLQLADQGGLAMPAVA